MAFRFVIILLFITPALYSSEDPRYSVSSLVTHKALSLASEFDDEKSEERSDKQQARHNLTKLFQIHKSNYLQAQTYPEIQKYAKELKSLYYQAKREGILSLAAQIAKFLKQNNIQYN